MIRRTPLLEAFELSELRRRAANYESGAILVEGMIREARQLGVWPPKNPLEGIEHDIALAKAIHALGTARRDRD